MTEPGQVWAGLGCWQFWVSVGSLGRHGGWVRRVGISTEGQPASPAQDFKPCLPGPLLQAFAPALHWPHTAVHSSTPLPQEPLPDRPWLSQLLLPRQRRPHWRLDRGDKSFLPPASTQ